MGWEVGFKTLKLELTLFMDGPKGFTQNILKLGSILAMMKMALDTSRVGF